MKTKQKMDLKKGIESIVKKFPQLSKIQNWPSLFLISAFLLIFLLVLFSRLSLNLDFFGAQASPDLSPPALVSVTPVSSTQIDIVWTDPNKSESGYVIERSDGTDSSFDAVTTTSKSKTTYQDKNLAPNITYYYRVKAAGKKGTFSSYSEVKSASTNVNNSSTVTLGTVDGTRGENVIVPLTLANNGTPVITAMQTDIVFDTSKLSANPTATIGAAASSAGKVIIVGYPARDVVRVIIYGMNTTAINDGTLANITFNISSSAATGPTPLNQTNVMASNKDIQPVTVTAQNGSVNIQ